MQHPPEESVAMAEEPAAMVEEPAEVIEEEALIEEVSIDGMCGVY